ncbi:MAG: aminotransferase class I/II-fold pyridoxal phosphate-dependent enzyme [Candidatus Micrarchaeia archaeon]
MGDMITILSKRSAFAGSPIQENDSIVAALAKKGKKIIRLNRGDPAPYFKTPKYIIDAYISALKNGITYYSSAAGLKDLREAVLKRHKRMYNLDADIDSVIITQGVSEALQFINSAMIDEGDSAVLFKPYYPLYSLFLNFYGGKAIMESYYESMNWNIDTDKLKKVIDAHKRDRIKYMLITNPNNPTGTVMGRNVLKEIVDIANDRGIFLISDEIYDEIVFNGANFTSLSEVAEGTKYMILNGASKDFDSTGFRLGYALIPGEDRDSMEVKRKFVELAMSRLSVNTPAQYAFAEGISNIKEHSKAVKSMVRQIADRANFVTRLVNDRDYMHAVEPNGAFYVFPRIDLKALHMKSDGEFVVKLLEEEGVQLTRGSGFGEGGHARIVALPPREILEEAVEKMDSFAKRHSAEA